MARNNRSILVVGLGRFGSSVATTLDSMGQDVLAVDKDPELVNRWSAQVPTIQADMTDVLAVEQLNASDFDTAVVAIGDSVEASETCWTPASATSGRNRCRRSTRASCSASERVTSSTPKRMQASASGIWCPETIWITSRSRARTPSSRSTRLRTWSAIPSRRHQGARQRVPVRFQGTGHAPQRRTRHHGQAGQHRQVHSRLTDARHPLHTPV